MSWHEQVPTQPVSIEEIMASPTFALGVGDGRAGRSYRESYQNWDIDNQWNYERGRAWASLVPRHVVLKHNGKVTAEAIMWFSRVGQHII
jgi:hypothetical protein